MEKLKENSENNQNLDENVNLHNNKKSSKFKKILAIVLIALIIGHIGMYISQRNTWLYKDQPYPKAKEWLIPANFMLVYGNYLTKLPFIDEKSFIMKPILKAQDYFVEKWKANLPDDDAEKYLDWYMFKFQIYTINKAKSIYLYKKYSLNEVREFNEKAWQTIENLVKYEAKDKEFQEIRYSAFNNLSVIFTTNFLMYWYVTPNIGYIDYKTMFYNETNKTIKDFGLSVKTDDYFSHNSYIDTNSRLKDTMQHERLIKLYDYIKYMDNLYATKYKKIYSKSINGKTAEYLKKKRLHDILNNILYWQIETNRYSNLDSFCNLEKNIYLNEFLNVRDWFIKNEKKLENLKLYISDDFRKTTLDKIKNVCQNLNL